MTANKFLRLLGFAAGAAWLASWFLPVMENYVGWQAFWATISPPRAFGTADSRSFEDAAPQLMSAATNFVFIGLLAFLLTGRVTRWGLFIRLALACVLLNLYWFVQLWRDHELDQLLIGYYAWQLGFVLLLISGVSGHRTSKTPTAGTPS